MNIKKTTINSVLLWWTSGSVSPCQHHSQMSRKLYNGDRSGECKCKVASIKPNWQANWTCKAVTSFLLKRHFRSKSNWLGENCQHELITFITCGNYKRRRVFGRVWMHDQLSALWRNTWKELDFTRKESAESYLQINFIGILNAWTENANCSL